MSTDLMVSYLPIWPMLTLPTGERLDINGLWDGLTLEQVEGFTSDQVPAMNDPSSLCD